MDHDVVACAPAIAICRGLGDRRKRSPAYVWTNWTRGVPQTDAGDLKMVTEWAKLGFIIRNPFLPPSVYDTAATGNDYIYVSIETQQR